MPGPLGGREEPLVVRALAPPCVALTLACVSPADTENRVSAQGFGGVHVGMNVEEASRAYGSPLGPAVPIGDDERSCYYVSPQGGVGPVSFMIVNERVARVDIDEPGPVTAAGVGVGSRESEVRLAYGRRVEASPHKYAGPQAHYLTVAEGDSAIIFETDGTRVITYRAGKLPEVGWVERCS